MKHSIYIDQLTLEYWKGQIDLVDSVLIAFIQDLDPKNPKTRISEKMWRGHFLVTLKWLQEQLPIVQLSQSRLYRRLVKLIKLGILESVQRSVYQERNPIRLTYYRLTDVFWNIYNSRHKAATDAAKQVRRDGNGFALAQARGFAFEDKSVCAGASNESIRDSLLTGAADASPARTERPDLRGSENQKRDSLGIVPQHSYQQQEEETILPREEQARRLAEIRKRLKDKVRVE